MAAHGTSAYKKFELGDVRSQDLKGRSLAVFFYFQIKGLDSVQRRYM